MQGNNYPLRGLKATVWEGGSRVMAFIAGGFLERVPNFEISLKVSAIFFSSFLLFFFFFFSSFLLSFFSSFLLILSLFSLVFTREGHNE